MLSKKKKSLKEIREAWGRPIDKFRNFDLISFYHESVSKSGEKEFIDDKTWLDLNMEHLFSYLDRSSSSIGQQFLYHLLRSYEKDSEILNKRNQIRQILDKNSELREELQLKLKGVNNTNSYFISSLIFGKLPDRPKLYFLIYLLPVLLVFSLIMIPFQPPFTFVAIGLSILNIIVEQLYSKRIYKYYSGFSALTNLITCAMAISKIKHGDELAQIRFLKKNRFVLRRLRSKIGSLLIDKASGNEFVGMILTYLNVIFLYDLITYLRSLKYLETQKIIIQNTFETVAELDASIAIASFLEEVPYYTVPEFTPDKKISFNEVYHPLIQDAVSNSISDIDRSVLITGSNMAGKTTFIKTIGINFILAQTLNICLAKKAVIPRLIVKSAIRREDNLEESKSYYFVEIERLLSFIELSENKLKYLFLIDEIFRGTNTVERLSSSTAVLKYLDRNNFSFVTTHDIELQELLDNTFSIYHFSEQVTDHKFYFDYKIKKGTTFSGNAIKLLELKGYPEEIIKEAGSVRNLLLSKTK